MANVIDYLKKSGNISFKELPFNELDGLVFARLSYIDFKNFVNSRKYFSKKNLIELASKLVSLNDSSLFKLKEDQILLENVVLSSRYKNIFIKTYVKETNLDKVKQFSATTFLNKEKKNSFLIVSFRGTDGTYTGRKEDFEMCYKPIVPAQQDSEKYLKKVTRFTFRNKVILVGHSKGGNLAIYSASFLSPNKILKIYAYDSPGFNNNFLLSENFQKIKSKIEHFAPQTSIIGRLLEKDYKTKIVDSNKSLLNQHNIYNWNIEGNSLSYLNKYTYISNKINDVIKRNLSSMSVEEKTEFVESLFGIIKELSNDDVIEFGDSLFSFALRFSKVLKNQSEETKKLIYSIFKKPKEEKKEEIKKVTPIPNEKPSFFKSLVNKFKKEN